MGKSLYTIVCRYYTINGIIEIDMYEVFKRLRLEPFEDDSYGYIRYTWRVYDLIRYHVYTGQAVEYVIKKVIRNIDINDKTKQFYSYYPPYSLMYDCRYDLKDVERMNYDSIDIRMKMTESEFQKAFGGKLW